jgi:hypothetical protein
MMRILRGSASVCFVVVYSSEATFRQPQLQGFVADT